MVFTFRYNCIVFCNLLLLLLLLVVVVVVVVLLLLLLLLLSLLLTIRTVKLMFIVCMTTGVAEVRA